MLTCSCFSVFWFYITKPSESVFAKKFTFLIRHLFGINSLESDADLPAGSNFINSKSFFLFSPLAQKYNLIRISNTNYRYRTTFPCFIQRAQRSFSLSSIKLTKPPPMSNHRISPLRFVFPDSSIIFQKFSTPVVQNVSINIPKPLSIRSTPRNEETRSYAHVALSIRKKVKNELGCIKKYHLGRNSCQNITVLLVRIRKYCMKLLLIFEIEGAMTNWKF